MIADPPILYYAIHHTAVSRSKNAAQLFAVNRYHQEKWNAKSTLGWFVGYNYFIDVDGTTTKCRDVGEETIAQVGHNCDVKHRCDTISICLTGDFNQETLTDAQVVALRTLVTELKTVYPMIVAKFHRELQPGRTCPGSLMTHQYLQSVVFGQPDPIDEEEKEKAERIAQLSQILDQLRAILTRLLSLGWRR